DPILGFFQADVLIGYRVGERAQLLREAEGPAGGDLLHEEMAWGTPREASARGTTSSNRDTGRPAPRSRHRSRPVEQQPRRCRLELRADVVTASKQISLLIVGEFGLGGIPRDVAQFLPQRSPGHCERTSGADGAGKGEGGGDRQHVCPAKGRGLGEEGG